MLEIPPMDASQELRKLPKIDRLLESAPVAGWVAEHGRDLVLESLRAVVDDARRAILAGTACPSEIELLEQGGRRLLLAARPTLLPVINATGVVLHTNLGRAPLSQEAAAAVARVAAGYSNLEFDLEEGERGSRYSHCAALLARLCGAEDALVVNNNAAAVTLALAAFARGREALVSRGELVEIGGGFRVPDVLRESGATLVEVGTTNRTYVRDYEAAWSERTAVALTVHRSNFRQVGFTHDPSLTELAGLAHSRGGLLVDDLGSGTLLDTVAFGLSHEPTVQERIAGGADLVCFSGDKLLGGPQIGCLVGRRELVSRLKSFPLLRALRVDKVTLAGFEATLRHYQRGDAASKIPVWRALSMDLAQLEAQVRAWAAALPGAEVVPSESMVGGGSLPGMSVKTWALALPVPSPNEFARRLRRCSPPVVARVEADRVIVDPRTVLPGEAAALLQALQLVSSGGGP